MRGSVCRRSGGGWRVGAERESAASPSLKKLCEKEVPFREGPVEEGPVEQALWWASLWWWAALWWASPHMIRLPRAERATSTPSWTVGEQGFRLGSSPCIEERCGVGPIIFEKVVAAWPRLFTSPVALTSPSEICFAISF